ncbi:hypothetical protein D3877_05825 [Azospirillum cavernae]|uniref:Uncharacterized protein n=1 Tax=Azospirillum cavernae TaxID=2320860 RepID=A0A418W261_9PROT|nr:hypothetical protein [Azospirillum cavernae]RJF84122.1 hypothetical protein D3877_05825 [Azospirillum cavernae]
MGPFSLTTAVVAASLLGTVVIDVGMNTLQNWYDTFYADALWSSRPVNGELDRQLKKEEAEIDKLMREENFVSEEPDAR